MDLADRGQPHHGVAAELGVVGHQEHLARIVDDRPRHPHLAVVVVEQRPVPVDAADADDADIDLELADEIERRLADDAAVLA